MELDLEKDVVVAMARTTLACRRVLQERFRDAGTDVTVAEFGVLGLLSKGDGRRVGEVAEFMSLDRTTVSRLVDGLVRKGLVRRREDPEDRRAVRLHLTSGGRRLFARLLPVRQEVVARATAGLSKKRRTDLVAGLADMRASLIDQAGAGR